MSKNKKKPWDKNWESISEKIGQGGQGETSLVKPKNDSFPPGEYVLKILHKQKDKERRARMSREVNNLKTFINPGIPKLIDSNYEYFEDLNIPLYMVTEFIEGSTLEKFIIEKGVIDVFDAVKFTIKLLDIVEYCHQRDVVHRDIKPDNIMVRNDSLTTPVLIDFGLSFNKEDDTNLTPTGQDIGNRFFVLPEHKRESGSQRDTRSDITQVCGILFFVITGKASRHLLDEKGNKPHQTEKARQKLSALPEYILSKINIVFDTAFRTIIDSRWQSIPALKTALINILESENQEYNEKILLDEIKYKVSTDIDKELFENVAKKFLEKIYDIVNGIIEELNSELQEPKFWGVTLRTDKQLAIHPEIDWKNLTFSNKVLGIGYRYANKPFWPGFEGYLTGSEVVVFYVEYYFPKSELDRMRSLNGMGTGERIYDETLKEYENSKTELPRIPLSGELDFTRLEEKLRKIYLKGIKKIM
ncbi:serine/threonine-protein kinase [Dapis sp. BLCC M229]|uniref:serine/threonine-protein kinase n=1 Tax=Dapis sp. BLCC M229 TaxID=3400188 RepID=UPI003CE7D64A